MSEWQPIEPPPDGPRDVEILTPCGKTLHAWYCRGCLDFHPLGKNPTNWRESPTHTTR